MVTDTLQEVQIKHPESKFKKNENPCVGLIKRIDRDKSAAVKISLGQPNALIKINTDTFWGCSQAKLS